MPKVNHLTNWPVVFVAYLTLFTLGLLDNTRGPYFADITNDLKLTDTEASLFFVMASLLAFLSGLTVPSLARRIGLMNVLRVGQIFLGLGFALIALSQSLLALVVTCSIFGYGFGLINVAQNLLLLGGSAGPMRRRLLSGLHGMYAFASLIAPLIVAHLFQIHIYWRAGFVGFALFTLMSFISTFFADSKDIVVDEKNKYGRLKKRSYGLIAAFLSFYVVSEVVLATRLALYVRRVFDYSPDQASIILALFFLCLLAGRFLFLFVPFKSSNIRVIEMSLATSFLVYFLGLNVHPALLVFCGLTMSPVFALSVDLIAEIFPNHSAEAISACLAISCAVIVSMQLVVGILSDLYGIRVALHSGLVTLVLSWVCLILVKKSERRKLA